MMTKSEAKRKAEALAKALAKVADLASQLEEFAEERGEDGQDFFYYNSLDNPYEFDLDATLEAINAL